MIRLFCLKHAFITSVIVSIFLLHFIRFCSESNLNAPTYLHYSENWVLKNLIQGEANIGNINNRILCLTLVHQDMPFFFSKSLTAVKMFSPTCIMHRKHMCFVTLCLDMKKHHSIKLFRCRTLKAFSMGVDWILICATKKETYKFLKQKVFLYSTKPRDVF